MQINLKEFKAISLKELFEENNFETDKLLDSITPAQLDKVILPSIYFQPNEDFSITPNTTQEGMMLDIYSTQSSIILCYQFYQNPFVKYFDNNKNKYIPFLKINRQNISGFKKTAEVTFEAVKPKQSYNILGNMGARPGGLIPSLIIEGAFKLAAKAEKSTVEKKGIQYKLLFLENNIEKSITLVSEKFYSAEFEDFLNRNWITSVPATAPDLGKTNEGCFIATACYGNYNHVAVIELRKFRDNVLSKSRLGQKFIISYYKFSPRLAQKIKKLTFVRWVIRCFILTPLTHLVKRVN